MIEPEAELTLELEPIDPTALRSTEGTAVWETVRGKRNRITIGRPRWLDPAETIEPAVHDRLRTAYPPADYALQMLALSLTLLPDRSCRFRSADLVLAIDDLGSPFVDLAPREELTTHLVSAERPGGHVALTLLSAVEVGLSSGAERRELTRSEAMLEAFGTGTPEAGWRLLMTRLREIPLDTPDLRAT